MPKNVDVLLVSPWAQSAAPPDSLVEDGLGVGYLTAVLREAGFSVLVLDAFIFYFDQKDIVHCVIQIDPKILGISLHSFADYRQCISIFDDIARLKPDIYRVIGGEHATFLANDILERHPNVDAIVIGEGEETFKEIASAVLSGKLVDKIAGAVVRRRSDDTIIDGGARQAIKDLDQIPHPHRDIVETAIRMGRPVAISMLTGRGCTNNCTFCTAHKFLRLGGGEVWRRRKPKAVVQEMEEIIQLYMHFPGVHPMIQFQDVIFLGTSKKARKWTEKFLDELNRRQITISYFFMTRPESIIANHDLLPLLAKSGLTSVEIGIESGVDRLLQAYNKQNSIAVTKLALNLLQSHGICYDASGFIMFDPRITFNELRTNALFLLEIGHARWDRYATRLQVFPGTVIRKQLTSEGLFKGDAKLDDVYSYHFQDPLVAKVAAHVWIYDDSVNTLDSLLRTAKLNLTRQIQLSNDTSTSLQKMVEVVEKLYCDHFLTLVNLAERDELDTQFEQYTQRFLVQVSILVNSIGQLLYSEESSNETHANRLILRNPARR